MNEGLEYIQRQINIVKQQVEGSNIKIIVTDPITKCQYDYYERELQTLESIENKLKALEIIKEKNVEVAMLKSYRTVERYNVISFEEYCFKYPRKLTKGEFNLLKEVLDNGTN